MRMKVMGIHWSFKIIVKTNQSVVVCLDIMMNLNESSNVPWSQMVYRKAPTAVKPCRAQG